MKRSRVMSRKVLLSFVVVLAIAVVGFMAVQNGNNTTETAVQTVVVAEEAATDEVSHAPGTLDATKALAPRSVGNPDAPVKIEEFASLSCGHCADFYKTTYPKLKEEYIDTGKVYFTYSDFPINAPALDAAMVARCLPEAHYFNFIKMLFENQSQWAFGGKHREILQHNAAMLGMSTEYFNACVDNTDLRDGLVKRMQEATDKHSINATPSFVVNGKTVLGGNLPYEKFKEAIEGVLLLDKAQ
jgi:protein-disulfide isomerase